MEENKNAASQGGSSELSRDELLAIIAKQDEEIRLLKKVTAMGESGSEPKIRFVHLIQRYGPLTTAFKVHGVEHNLHDLGEIFSLSQDDAEEFVGNYRQFFKDGLVAVSEENAKWAKEKGVPTPVKGSLLTKDALVGVEDWPSEKLAAVYKAVPRAQKDMLISIYKSGIGDKNPKFMNLDSVKTLNRLADGALDMELGILVAAEAKAAKKKD